MTKKQIVEKTVYFTYTSVLSVHHLKEVRIGSQLAQKREQNLRVMEGHCLLTCMTSSANFLIEAITTIPGMTPPTMSWAFTHQPLVKRISYR